MDMREEQYFFKEEQHFPGETGMDPAMKPLVDFAEAVRDAFHLAEPEAASYSPLVLAYIGDGVYELVIRSILISRGNTQVSKLNARASALVKASAQAALSFAIEDRMTEEEETVFRRGRNAKSYTMAKHATMADYRRATGLEALCGYLYLKHSYERLAYLLQTGLEKAELLKKAGVPERKGENGWDTMNH